MAGKKRNSGAEQVSDAPGGVEQSKAAGGDTIGPLGRIIGMAARASECDDWMKLAVGLIKEKMAHHEQAGPDETPRTREHPMPLTTRERKVLDYLLDLPPAQGLKGREILDRLSRDDLFLDQSTLTKFVIPKLKSHYSVVNVGGVGYLIDPAGREEVERKLALNTP